MVAGIIYVLLICLVVALIAGEIRHYLICRRLNTKLEDVTIKINEKRDDTDKDKFFIEQFNEITDTIRELEKDRERKFGEINSTLSSAKDVMYKVGNEVHNLSLALTNSASRGQFGEKLAEDIINKIGFVENINYSKQKPTPDNTRPDFTFLLPNGIECNMDSKFPLSNYLKHLDAKEEDARKTYLTKFLKDVRERIKEVGGKGYINEKTTDFLLIFIPNTGVFDFILQNDPDLIDYAFDNKVVLCSPFTLYLVLRVFFQVHHLFNLDKKVVQAITKLDKFYLEWHKMKEEERKFDDKLEKLNEARATIRGTRTRVLEKAIEEMRG